MRLPDLLGVVAALVVGGLLVVLLLASAVAAPPALPTPVPPSIPPLPTPTRAPNATPTPAPAQSPAPPIAAGQTAPPLQVTLLDGSLLDTADYAGTPMWINFMATWNPQSAEELPLMQRYQTDYADAMNLFVVDVGEDPEVVEADMNQLEIELPVGLDEDSSQQAAWGIRALPQHVFIDEDGVVQQIVYGGAPLEVWDAAIALIVPEFIPPSPTPG